MASTLPLAAVRRSVENAILLAGFTLLVALPMFSEQFVRLGPLIFERPPDADGAWQLAVKQAVMIFCIALLCALVGFLYAQRLHLPGLGRFRHIPYWLGWGLAGGVISTPPAYFSVDRAVMRAAPELYPAEWHAALADMLGTAVLQEVIVRFGLLTILIYFLHRLKFKGYPWPALLCISAFATFGLYNFLARLGIGADLSAPLLLIALATTFAVQWLYGEVYLRWGLLASMCVHFGVSVKFLWYTF